MKHLQKKLNFILFIFFTSFAYSQIIAEKAMPSEQISFRPQVETEGLIIGSITFPKEKARFNGYFFNISAISDDKKTVRKNSGEFFVKPEQIFKVKHQGESDKGLTYMFIIKKPVGQYVINRVRLSTLGYMSSKDDFITNFEIPFEVKKGEITYIGNIGLNEFAEVDEKIITFNNTYERDVRLLLLLQPYVLWKTAVNDPNRQIIYK